MGKIATLLQTSLFVILLAGLIVIQYCWITTVQKDKWEKLKYQAISGIEDAASNLSAQALTSNAVAGSLQRSFSAKGLGSIPFEFNVHFNKVHLASKGFNQQLTKSVQNLTLIYVFKESPEDLLTVVIPSASGLVWKDMTGTIAISVLLVLMILTVFYFAAIWGPPGLQLFYSRRDKVIKNMMEQFEGPLATVSVAAEALRNAAVMRDAAKIRFYQQVINEENKRMNEEVKRVLRELE